MNPIVVAVAARIRQLKGNTNIIFTLPPILKKTDLQQRATDPPCQGVRRNQQKPNAQRFGRFVV